MSNGTLAGSTSWELHLKDYVSAGFNKLTEYATGTQKKINEVSGSLDKVGKASVSSTQEIRRSYTNQEQYLKALKKEIKNTFDDKEINWYKKKITETTSELDKMKKTITPSAGAWSTAKSSLSSSLNQIPGYSGIMGLATNPLAIGIGAIGGALYESGKEAIEYNTGMAKINATAQLTNETLGDLQHRLQEIGSTSGGNFDKIPEAYNLIYKQTHLVNRSLDELEVSTKAAKAGFVDLTTAAEAEAKMSVVLGKEYTNATDIMDVYFSTITKGNGDLATTMSLLPNLIELGKGVGLHYKDTAGIYTFFTKIGESAEQANTDMVAVFNTLRSEKVITKFNEADKDLYDKKGKLKRGAFSKESLSLFDEKGTMKSFDKIIGSLKSRMDGMSQEMKIKFLDELGVDDNRKAKSILKLTDNYDDLKKSIDAVNASTGSLNKSYHASEGVARSWGSVADKWKDAMTSTGTLTLPLIDETVTLLDNALKGWVKILSGDWKSEGKKQNETMLEHYNSQKRIALMATDIMGKKEFGDNWDDDKKLVGTNAGKFYNSQFHKLLDDIVKNDTWTYGQEKNNIKKGEKTPADKAKDKVNDGTSGGSASGSGSETLTSNVGGLRSLIMNVKINNTFKDGDQANVKRKTSDDLVDAARDAMVTIGAN